MVFFVYISKIHSTISGVLLAMCLPANSDNSDNSDKSVLENVNDNLSPLCNYLILPLFAFSNTGINLSANVNYSELKTLIKGIMGGLIIGKPLGIMLFSYIGVKLHLIEKKTQRYYMVISSSSCNTCRYRIYNVYICYRNSIFRESRYNRCK